MRSRSEGLIVLRTHYIDSHLKDFACRLAQEGFYDFAFAVDEDCGPHDANEHPTISLSKKRFEEIGLFVEPYTAWKCGDYALYLARRQFPGAKMIWLCEHDVRINKERPQTFFQEIDAISTHDFLAAYFGRSTDEWEWWEYMADEYSDVYQCNFPLVRLSASAIDALFAARLKSSAQAMATARSRTPLWPNDEVFVATFLANNGFKCADFNSLGSLYSEKNFGCLTVFHPRQLPVDDGHCYHAVLTGTRLLEAIRRGKHWDITTELLLELLPSLADHKLFSALERPLVQAMLPLLADVGDNPDKVLSDDVPLVTKFLEPYGHREVIMRSVFCALAEIRMLDCIEALRGQAIAKGWSYTRHFDNLALARPAWQSSFSEWSRFRDIRLDAEGANNGSLGSDYGFHTLEEDQPWWAVDLGDVRDISEIRIFNRRKWGERLEGFVVFSSTDAINWTVIFESGSGQTFDGTADFPIRIVLNSKTSARYIRVLLPRQGILHFVELEAYNFPTIDSGQSNSRDGSKRSA